MTNVKELNADQQNILNYIEEYVNETSHGPCQLLIQGAAGTGKSFLINEIRNLLKKEELKCIVGTHQAIAASIIGGYTLYKIFGFFGSRDISRINKNGMKYTLVRSESRDGYKVRNKSKDWFLQEYKNFNELAKKNWLIIDEISMIGLEFLDDMDHILQTLFNSTQPFGGINLIFSGHFAQLKPVKEIPIFRLKTDHFIKHIKLFELKINQRQTNQIFFDLCNSVMKGCLKSEQKKLLKSRLVKNFKYIELVNLVHIFPTKKLCNEHNLNRLLELDEQTYYFIKAKDMGDNTVLSKEEKNNFNGLYNYIICCNKSKIMITVNEDPFINGEIYTIEDISASNEITKDEFFKDLFDNKKEIERIQKELLRKKKTIKYVIPDFIKISLANSNQLSDNPVNKPDEPAITNVTKDTEKQAEPKKGQKVTDKLRSEKYKMLPISFKNVEITNVNNQEPEIIFQRQMFPFQLAWAVTTHKIQGISLEEGVIDMGEANFDPVQLYVNISRLKSLDKLYITDLKLPLPVSPDRKLIKKFISEIQENNENNTIYQPRSVSLNVIDGDDLLL